MFMGCHVCLIMFTLVVCCWRELFSDALREGQDYARLWAGTVWPKFNSSCFSCLVLCAFDWCNVTVCVVSSLLCFVLHIVDKLVQTLLFVHVFGHVGVVSLKFVSHQNSVWHDIAWWFCGMTWCLASRSVVVFIGDDVEFYEILCSVAWVQGPSNDWIALRPCFAVVLILRWLTRGELTNFLSAVAAATIQLICVRKDKNDWIPANVFPFFNQ